MAQLTIVVEAALIVLLLFFGLGEHKVKDERTKGTFRANESARLLAWTNDLIRNSNSLAWGSGRLPEGSERSL